nr:hypothetical protein [Tanacetum cinerariifolium]
LYSSIHAADQFSARPADYRQHHFIRSTSPVRSGRPRRGRKPAARIPRRRLPRPAPRRAGLRDRGGLVGGAAPVLCGCAGRGARAG